MLNFNRLRGLHQVALVCALASATVAGAQSRSTRPGAGDSLRVLRFQPDSVASPVAPVVIAFDRPVAPELDESIAPESLLTIVPAKRHRTYWRDPSTLVAEFDELWTPGASYQVRLAPGLRALGGRPLARQGPWRVRVQMPRLVDILPIGAAYEEGHDMPRVANPSAHVNLVFSSPVTAPALAGRLWFVPADCSNRDSVRLVVRSIRRIEAGDSHLLKEAGGYDRDRRLDSLRRVVEVRAERPPPRGCIGIVRVPTFGATGVPDRSLHIAPVFALAGFETHTSEQESRECTGSRCEAGAIIVRFSQPVTREELLARVRIDGRAPRLPEHGMTGPWQLTDTLHAGQRLRISIDRSLTSKYGERIGAAVDTALTGWQLKPAVGLSNGQVVLRGQAPYLLRIRYANTDSVRVIIARVADTSRSRALAYGGNESDRVRWASVVRDSIVRVVVARADSAHEGALNVLPGWVPAHWGNAPLLAIRALPIKTAPPAPHPTSEAKSLPRVTVGPGGDYHEPRFAVAQRSDLAAHAARHGDVADVWVTRRGTGEPVRGARVLAFTRGSQRLAEATTDSLGVARLTGIGIRTARDVAPDQHLEVVSDGDRVLLALPRGHVRDDRSVPDDSISATPTVIATRGTLRGAAFADRGIYRPGQRVYVKGIARAFRSETGFRVPAADSARWTLAFEHDGSSEPIATRTGRLGEFGTYSDSLDLPATARVGWYRATLAVHDQWGWRDAATASFAIAEYRVPEFAVRATADTSTPLYAGDSATIRIAANYLFGPPMANADVNATVYTADAWSATPRMSALEGFEVGRATWLDEERAQERDEQPAPARLGADGTLVMRVPSRRISRPGMLSVSVDVQDANRQTIAASATVPLRVADAFVGIRTEQRRWDWTAGKPIPLQVIAVRGDGSIRPGTTVKLSANRISWTGGRWKRDTTWRDSVTSGDGPVRASFLPTGSGWYEIIASIRDDRGRVAESGVHVGVMGADWQGRQGGLFLSLDRHDAKAGDTVSVTIEAPANVLAWASLRTPATSWQRLVTLERGLNVLRVPLAVTSTQSVPLHVMATRAVPSTAPRADVPYFYHATTWISVSDSTRNLRVRIATDRGRYQPRDTVQVRVDVSDRDGRGRRGELAVWAVDEGVVSLTAYRPPALLAQLLQGGWEHWWLGSTLLGTLMPGPPGLGPVYSRYGLARSDVTGAASVSMQLRGATYSADAFEERVGQNAVAANVPALRHRFATTPFFAGHVVTDADGRATTSFVLPDNVTTYRLFAVAVDDEVRAGSGDTTIVTTRPLVVRAALPRAVRRGDSLFAGAVLTAEGAGAATPVTLAVRADGMRIDGSTTALDTLVGARARERRFPMLVQADDSVTVGFSAASASDGDAVMTRLPVSTSGRPRAHVAMGTLRGEEIVELALPEDLDPTRSRLVLQSGQSPLPLLRELDERLRVYPYACTEQVASAARALIARVRLERTIGHRATLAPADRKRLELAVNALLDKQRQDGGFGYWSATHWTTPWLTSHALDALLGARELGVAVPQVAFDRALRYLGADPVIGDYLRQQWLPPADSAHWAHEALHAARLLRKLHRPDTTLERRLWALRANLDFEDRLTLARLRAAAGDSVGARALVDQAWRSVRVEGRRVVVEDSVVRRRWLFRTVTGTYTGLLRATAALRPAHPQLAPLLESVLQSARSDAVARWNTVDQTMLAETIEAVAAPLGLNATARVAVTDLRGTTSTLELQPAGADSLALTLERFVAAPNGRRSLRVRLTSASNTPTYYALTLYEVPVVRPVRPDQEGIAVERWYERYADGKPITEVNEGELVRVRLRITAPRDREFVVIDDPLPAGLEAVDQSLRTTGSLPPYAGAPKLEGDSREGPVGQKWLYGSWDGGWWTPWEHKEIRDDRVLWFARQLWRGSYQASYVARATTAGQFVRPPAQAEEMYNPSVHGRSEGGVFSIRSAPLTTDPTRIY